MKGLPMPETIIVYQLLKMTGASISPSGTSSFTSMGMGFYTSKQEAEHQRTIEILKDQTSAGPKPTWHIFELEFPNPAVNKE